MAASDQAYQQQEFIFTQTGPMRVNMIIVPKKDEQNPLYFIHVKGSISDNTDITMHAGTDKSDQVLGSCRFSKFYTTKMLLTLGDQKSHMMFSPQYGCYSWSLLAIRHIHGKVQQRRREFLWKRTEESRVSGSLGLELCGVGTADVYAVYFGAAPGSRKVGILRVRIDLGDMWKTMVLLTLSALLEKERQRKAREEGIRTVMLVC
ncbi:uncharacterized protein BDW43DRAFT_276274 [Aspergillus alliaceus]|uniref:uncharacterized protein n=1 Tax=Petromyces alliaceus TaxID=209559 RepID=UPI0012A45FBE|nr:uncharacterized protein BDW43DRAFT_276274 [Aspergillus alliaceus]KAB8233429.1 hypothetical protein BDW43DRAFT_276274 [Aspergillus alliaceus]